MRKSILRLAFLLLKKKRDLPNKLEKKTASGEIRTFKFIEPKLSIQYCKKHYEQDKKLKLLNLLLDISIYLFPSIFIVGYILLLDFVNSNMTLAIIICTVLGMGFFFGMMWLKHRIMCIKHKYGIALGILKFDFSPFNDRFV